MLHSNAFLNLQQNILPLILVIEDSEEDYEILQRCIRKSTIECKLQHCETGEDALEYLYNRGDFQDSQKYYKPSLILLDLNLPAVDGREILETIKKDNILNTIPVVIFSTSSNPKDIQECYHKGANAYVIKPMDILLMREHINILLQHWLKVNTFQFRY